MASAATNVAGTRAQAFQEAARLGSAQGNTNHGDETPSSSVGTNPRGSHLGDHTGSVDQNSMLMSILYELKELRHEIVELRQHELKELRHEIVELRQQVVELKVRGACKSPAKMESPAAVLMTPAEILGPDGGLPNEEQSDGIDVGAALACTALMGCEATLRRQRAEGLHHPEDDGNSRKLTEAQHLLSPPLMTSRNAAMAYDLVRGIRWDSAGDFVNDIKRAALVVRDVTTLKICSRFASGTMCPSRFSLAADVAFGRSLNAEPELWSQLGQSRLQVYTLGRSRTLFMKRALDYNVPVVADDLEKLYSAYHATVAHGKGRVQEATSRCSKRKKKPSQAQGQAGELVSGEVADEQAPDGTHVDPAPGETEIEQVCTSLRRTAGGSEASTPWASGSLGGAVTEPVAGSLAGSVTPFAGSTMAWFDDWTVGGTDCWPVDGAVGWTGDAIWEQHDLLDQWRNRLQDQSLERW